MKIIVRFCSVPGQREVWPPEFLKHQVWFFFGWVDRVLEPGVLHQLGEVEGGLADAVLGFHW